MQVAPPIGGVAHFFRRPGSLITGMVALFHRNIQHYPSSCLVWTWIDPALVALIISDIEDPYNDCLDRSE